MQQVSPTWQPGVWTGDKSGTTWRWIENYANYRLILLTKELEMPGLSQGATENVRGAIQELRSLLKSVEPSRMLPSESDG